MPLAVVCPSSRRPERVLAARAITLDCVCVPHSERRQYVRANPQLKIVSHPDRIVGLPAKRQWIHDRFGDVFMVDDDVSAFLRLYQPTFRHNNRLLAEDARAIVESLYQTATEAGAFLFSLAPHGDARHCEPQHPFRLTGYVNGAAFGIRAGSQLWFPRDVTAVADIALSGLNAHFHRFLLMDTRFGFRQAKTFANPGGLAAARTGETEIADTARLKQMFGDAIQPKRDARKKNRNFHTPANRSLVIPW